MLGKPAAACTILLAFGVSLFGGSFRRQGEAPVLRTSTAPPPASPAFHGPTLKVRLLTGLTTYTAKPGTPFTAVAVASFEQNGRVVIPRGALISGTVRKTSRVGFGIVHERASLSLDFNRYQLQDGREFPFQANLASVDNAREQLRTDGTIRGILAARNPNGLINGFWYRPDFSLFYRSLIGLTGTADQLVSKFDMGPVGAIGFLALHCTIRFPDPEIRLAPGTDLELDAKVTTPFAPTFAAEPPSPVPAELASLIGNQPREVTRADLKPASDIINVAFIGSREELTQAFLSAGWSNTDQQSIRTFSHVYASFSSMQTYRSAPVSKMLYRGELPEMVFQKSLNTVSKRHHVRLWDAGTYEGRQVWLGAATHDTGVRFHASAVEFQHKIDPEIDHERAKIIEDLTFAGCSKPAGFVTPTEPAPKSSEGDVYTDNRIAVLSIGTCSDDQDYPGLAGMKSAAPWMVRFSRRLILETRNYLTREQPYYWGYQIARSSRKLMLHHAPAPAGNPVVASAAKPAESATQESQAKD